MSMLVAAARRSALRDFGHGLGTPVGRWRTQLLLRGYGTSVLLTSLHQYHWNVQRERRSIAFSWTVLQAHIAARPIEEHLVTLAAVALMVAGARGIVLVFAALSMSLLVRRNMAEPWLFPAVEYVLFAVVPWLGIAAIVAEWGRATATATTFDLRAAHVDRTIVACFRIALLTTMLFVTLHKLNDDFMDRATTCENVIAGWLEEAWGSWGTAIKRLGSPWATVLTEASIPLLLFWWPAVGIVVTSGFFLMLGLVGAPSTAGIVMVMAWAFCAHEDAIVLRARRYGIAAGATAIGVTLVGLLLARYRGTALSREMVALVVTMAVVPGVCALALLPAGRPGWFAAAAGGGAPRASRWVSRGVPALATLALMWNGMAPYLGLRFNYSFAMWSNLRVDQQRWNSWVVPAWVQVRPVSEQFIDVQEVAAVPLAMPVFSQSEVQTARFIESVAPLVTRQGIRLDLVVTWAGQQYTFAGPADLYRLSTLLAEMGGGATPGAERVAVQRALVIFDPGPEAAGPTDGSVYETRLEPALFSPTGFRHAMDRAARQRQNADLRFSYQGRPYRMTSILTNDEFRRFVAGLHENNLFPAKLSRSGPQRCFH